MNIRSSALIQMRLYPLTVNICQGLTQYVVSFFIVDSAIVFPKRGHMVDRSSIGRRDNMVGNQCPAC